MTPRRLLVLSVALWCLVIMGVSVGYAHAEIQASSPGVGAVFRWTRPAEIRLTFSQEVILDQTTVTLYTRQFQSLALPALQQDPSDLTTVFVTLPSLADGTYTVDWKTLSVDEHSLQGAYDFTVMPRTPLVLAVAAPVVLILLGLGVIVARRRAHPTV
jgi:copper transport protein